MKSNKNGKHTSLRIASYILTIALTLGVVFLWQNRNPDKTSNASLRADSTTSETTLPEESRKTEDTEKTSEKTSEKKDSLSDLVDKAGQDESKLDLNLPVNASDLQRAAVKAIPSVVLIKTYNPMTTGDYFANFMQQYQHGNAQSSTEEDNVYSQRNLVGEGSGIIYTADGYIITNAHVLAGGSAWQVVTTEGTVYNAEKVGADDITDVAVLKIDAQDLPAADIGVSSALSIAEQVMAIGNPAGEELSSTVTVGYVSALNRVINAANGTSLGYIQTDTAINPGNSGGALVNLKGQVVGINTSKLNAARYEGLGFAIPMDTAIPLVKDMIEYGEVQGRVTLGVIGSYVQSQYIDSEGKRIQGFLIARVQNPELQEKGVGPDDLITMIDDVDINSTRTLRNYLASKEEGDTVSLRILRPNEGKAREIEVTLHSSYGDEASSQTASRRAG